MNFLTRAENLGIWRRQGTIVAEFSKGVDLADFVCRENVSLLLRALKSNLQQVDVDRRFKHFPYAADLAFVALQNYYQTSSPHHGKANIQNTQAKRGKL